MELAQSRAVQSMRWVSEPSSYYVFLGKARLIFSETDSIAAETLSKDSTIAAQRGLRRYIANHLKAHPALLWRFVHTGMSFEYQIDSSSAQGDETVVTVSVWFEPAKIDWDLLVPDS